MLLQLHALQVMHIRLAHDLNFYKLYSQCACLHHAVRITALQVRDFDYAGRPSEDSWLLAKWATHYVGVHMLR
jgi:hypothetical protein